MDSDDADFPDFVCKNMDRIPKYAPEEIDLASVVQRLSVVEDKLLNLHTVENKVAQVERSFTKMMILLKLCLTFSISQIVWQLN